MAHNHHMLAFAGMMQGESLKATRAIQELLASIPDEFIRQDAAMVDGFFAMPYELHMRFGRWDQMLAEPKPRKEFPISTAMWRYGRGVAFAAKRNVEAAKKEQQAFLAAKKAVPKEATFGKNKASTLLRIAEKMLAGEILYREGETEQAFVALRDAVRREDRLRYMEPPDWIQPVRHALGAALIESKRYAEAEAVYRADLEHYPKNGWSLYGLSRSLKMQGKKDEALAVSTRFDQAWKHADIKLTSSCFCLQGKE
jgi:tetratricopeptide (TPR) repeat protein